MKDIDIMVRDQLVPFRERILETFARQHPVVYTGMKTFLGGKQNKVGMQVLSGNVVVGMYTFTLEGPHIVKVDIDTLAPVMEVPMLGSIKMYAQIDQKDLEAMLQDNDLVGSDIIKAGMKYLPAVTLKFL